MLLGLHLVYILTHLKRTKRTTLGFFYFSLISDVSSTIFCCPPTSNASVQSKKSDIFIRSSAEKLPLLSLFCIDCGDIPRYFASSMFFFPLIDSRAFTLSVTNFMHLLSPCHTHKAYHSAGQCNHSSIYMFCSRQAVHS